MKMKVSSKNDCEQRALQCNSREIYYHCKHSACKVRFSPQDVHAIFEKVLDDIKPKKGVLKLADTLTKNLYDSKTKDFYADTEANKKRLQDIEKEQEQFLQSACRTFSDAMRAGYEKQYELLEEEKIKLSFDVTEQKVELIPFGEVWVIVSDFISNPKQVWVSGGYVQNESV